ncbi:MAG: recombinase family protein [Lachnospiraceae bacterium]|nr:recombinase family protein [Lachnospiraceae bacterium]
MSEKKKAAGYVKLAKLWEKNRETALKYHRGYYEKKFKDDPDYELYGVYVDITGKKEIRKRPEMVRLIKDCRNGEVDCVFTQTKGYIAANNREFMYLTHYLFTLDNGVDIVTEDEQYHIDTVENEDEQKEALLTLAKDYIALNPADYDKWVTEIKREIDRSGL